MKPENTFIVKTLFAVCSFTFILFSCKKENTIISNVSVQSGNEVLSQLTVPHPIKNFEGNYTVVGIRNNYLGPVSDSIFLYYIDLSVYSPKLMTAVDDSTLVFDYANLGSSGWQLLVTVNSTTKKITNIQPNETMAAGIMPGSFIVHTKKANLNAKRFYFYTEYTNTTGNGRTVEETLTKQ